MEPKKKKPVKTKSENEKILQELKLANSYLVDIKELLNNIWTERRP